MRNFEKDEFDNFEKMDKAFLNILDEIRHISGVPMIITSDYRNKKKNKEVGGAPDSAHLYGYAVDVACSNSVARMALINASLECGVTRIGVASNFLHFDIADRYTTKPKNVLWVY
jgi:zinc D-Ala-D-Ala carboxypeptidase